jgi:uncharacterized protein (TIGR03118 family)
MRYRRLLTMAIALATGVFVSAPAISTNANEARGSFKQTNLVTDNQALLPPTAQAKLTDTSLLNPWGISSSKTSPMWVSDNNAGVTTLYTGTGAKVQLTVTIPAASGNPPGTSGSPTGTIFNGNAAEFGGDRFLFASEDGAISGWQPPEAVATIRVDNLNVKTGSVYKGLAIGFDGLVDHLYAANFRLARVDVFNSDYSPAGSFTDPKVPAGYAPFNVQNLGGVLYVTFAKQNADKHDDVAGPGHGFVDAFDLNGHLLDRLVSRGRLNSPWGLAIAPASFGAFAGDLLVGNFGDGRINAYTLDEGDFRGQLRGTDGAPLTIDGLWALRVGNGGGTGTSGDPNAVYFTAGINHESDGLFGTITFVGGGGGGGD